MFCNDFLVYLKKETADNQHHPDMKKSIAIALILIPMLMTAQTTEFKRPKITGIAHIGIFTENLQNAAEKEQLSEVLCKHAERENGLQDLMEIMIESMMVAERREYLHEDGLPGDKGNGFRMGHTYGQGRTLTIQDTA